MGIRLTVDLQACSQANPQVHRRRPLMNNNNLSQGNNNNVICELAGLFFIVSFPDSILCSVA